MPRAQGERLEHRGNHDVDHQDDRAEARIEAMDALWDNHRSLNKQELDLVVFGERKGGEDDRSQAQWQTIQDGLAQEKMDDKSLSDFAVATASYVKDARKEALDSDIARDYAGLDHLLVEKVDSIEANLTAHALQTISERSNWYPFPGEDRSHYENHVELANMAKHGKWEDIPERLRNMHQEESNRQAERPA